MTIAILTALLIYTIPLNIVYVALFITLELIYAKSLNVRVCRQMYYGILVAITLYIPILTDMLSYGQINAGRFNPQVFIVALPEVITGFISHRWLLTSFIFIGLISIYTTESKSKMLKLCFWMMLLPFPIFFIIGSHLYGRMLLPVLPFFCLFVAICLDECLIVSGGCYESI